MCGSQEIESIDISALIIDFLSDALTLMHSNKCVLYAAEFEYMDDTSLTAFLKGYQSEGFDEDVKAVTYHGSYVRTLDNGDLEAMIVLDI